MTVPAPASMKASMWASGLLTMRCASSGNSVTVRTAATIEGPKLIGGTKCPSITSIWMASAPAASASRT